MLLAAFVLWAVYKRPWQTPTKIAGVEAADTTPQPEPD